MSDSVAAATTAAPPPSEVAQPAQSEVQAQTPIDDEIDLGEGQRFKRSELKERLKRKAEWEQQSHQRFQEAAQMKKEIEQAFQLVKTNPAEFLKKTGIDPEEFSKAYLQDKLKYYEMSPAER